MEALNSFVKANPLLAPMSLVGAYYVLSNLWDLLSSAKRSLFKTDLSTLKQRYPGEWAFVADVGKPSGRAYAAVLSRCGYNILALKSPATPHLEAKAEVEAAGRLFDVVDVEPFCASFAEEDIVNLEAKLAGKRVGVAVMNLFFESPCNFHTEMSIVLVGVLTACLIKTTSFTETLLKHMRTQKEKSAFVAVGSILGSAGWPCHQLSSGSAAYLEELTGALGEKERAASGKVDFLYLKRGYVPELVQNSYYKVEEKVEAEQGLRNLGICTKTAAHYRASVQEWFHCGKWGKNNRFVYSHLGALVRQRSST